MLSRAFFNEAYLDNFPDKKNDMYFDLIQPTRLLRHFIEVARYFENIGKSKQNSFFKD